MEYLILAAFFVALGYVIYRNKKNKAPGGGGDARTEPGRRDEP